MRKTAISLLVTVLVAKNIFAVSDSLYIKLIQDHYGVNEHILVCTDNKSAPEVFIVASDMRSEIYQKYYFRANYTYYNFLFDIVIGKKVISYRKIKNLRIYIPKKTIIAQMNQDKALTFIFKKYIIKDKGRYVIRKGLSKSLEFDIKRILFINRYMIIFDCKDALDTVISSGELLNYL